MWDDIFKDRLDRYPDFDLSAALDEAAVDYDSAFHEYWNFGGQTPPEFMERDDWAECRRLYELAKQIARIASTLTSRKGFGAARVSEPALLEEEARKERNHVREVLDVLTKDYSGIGPKQVAQIREALNSTNPADARTRHAVVKNTLQVQAWNLFNFSPATMAERMLKLTRYVVHSPAPRTADYLRLVARCYILGLDDECAVMARAALDAALEERFDDECVRQMYRLQKRERVGLALRIDCARAQDAFNDVTCDAALRVKKAGDDAAHAHPGLAGEIDNVLDDLARSANAITPQRR